jgi:hypothetical protein
MTLFPNNSDWRSAMQDVSAAIDDTMAEPVLVTPATAPAPNFAAAPDASRAVTVVGVFTRKAENALGGSRLHGGQNITPLVSTSKPVFSFGYNVLPWPIRQGYRITLLRTSEVFEVTDAKADGVSRINVDVVQLGRQREDGPGIVPPAPASPLDDPRVPPNRWGPR